MFVSKKAYNELEARYKALEALRIPQGHEERIAELEVKMSKLWSLLTTTSMRGEEKLSKFGRKFGGQSLRT